MKHILLCIALMGGMTVMGQTANSVDTVCPRSLDEILNNTQVSKDVPTFNRLLAPWVFTQYRALDKKRKVTIPDFKTQEAAVWRLAGKHLAQKRAAALKAESDSLAKRKKLLDSMWGNEPAVEEDAVRLDTLVYPELEMEPVKKEFTGRPEWLAQAYEAWNMQEDMMYEMMVDNPSMIEYAYWMLPVPPKLPDEDYSFHGFLKRNSVSGIDISNAVIKEAEIEKRHWLHTVNAALQFSQAYLSPNWYQGGNDHVALLANFLWDVQLNKVWHPNVLFQSTLSYKLGLNSVERAADQYRRYAISQDLFQYNFKFGYKARRNWYYSFTAQLKTQMLNNYRINTMTRIASFLTPGDLNFGIGMTYSKSNKAKTLQFNASIAPLSYNLKSALDDKVDHALFKMSQTAKFQSEMGSNADLTFNWTMSKIINYKTRLFLFSDYKNVLGDWENTLNFQFSRFFSTQLFFNMRYDSSAQPVMVKLKDKHGNYLKDDNGNIIEERSKWKKLMLKEILSVGLSYQFSTK